MAEVFDYVTTAQNWPAWHPASLSVIGAVDHSAEAGEQICEEIKVGGLRDRVVWTVRERKAPQRWMFSGKGARGGRATITYNFSNQYGGTLFERKLVYGHANWFYNLFNVLFVKRLMQQNSEKALQRLKVILESSQTA